MNNTVEKIATVKVGYTGWDWDDIYTMKSPTGKILRVRPNGHWSKGTAPIATRLNVAEENVLKRIEALYGGQNAPNWSACPKETLEVSYDDMRLFKTASIKTR